MNRIFFALLAAILLSIMTMTACTPNEVKSLIPGQSESSDLCSEITATTSVQVLLPPGSVALGKNAYRFTDPDAVRRLVDFVNPRRNVSPPTADQAPYPSVKVTFYSGTRNVGIFGSGTGVFYFQCGTVRGTRYASAAELAEFQMLTARPEAASAR
jgi:hypothetical protein